MDGHELAVGAAGSPADEASEETYWRESEVELEPGGAEDESYAEPVQDAHPDRPDRTQRRRLLPTSTGRATIEHRVRTCEERT